MVEENFSLGTGSNTDECPQSVLYEWKRGDQMISYAAFQRNTDVRKSNADDTPRPGNSLSQSLNYAGVSKMSYSNFSLLNSNICSCMSNKIFCEAPWK